MTTKGDYCRYCCGEWTEPCRECAENPAEKKEVVSTKDILKKQQEVRRGLRCPFCEQNISLCEECKEKIAQEMATFVNKESYCRKDCPWYIHQSEHVLSEEELEKRHKRREKELKRFAPITEISMEDLRARMERKKKKYDKLLSSLTKK
jgi:hypothetical protein